MSIDLGKTVGVEIEARNVPLGASRRKRFRVFNTTGDGSIRNYTYFLNGIPTTIRNNLTRREECGTEFVSGKISLNDEDQKKSFMYDLDRIFEWIKKYEFDVSSKTSVHIHVNITGIDRESYLNIFRIAEYLEASLYRISTGLVKDHRGIYNADYGYCRPITSMGPPVTRTYSGNWRQCFSTEALYNTRNWEEVRQVSGRADYYTGKYVSPRYLILNPVSFFRYGTAEFRGFNFTFSPKLIVEWIRLCQGIIWQAIKNYPLVDMPKNPLGTEGVSFDEIIEFLGYSRFENLHLLEDAWNSSGWQPPVKGYQSCHLGREIDWSGIREEIKPPIVDENDIIQFPTQRELDNNEVILERVI